MVRQLRPTETPAALRTCSTPAPAAIVATDLPRLAEEERCAAQTPACGAAHSPAASECRALAGAGAATAARRGSPARAWAAAGRSALTPRACDHLTLHVQRVQAGWRGLPVERRRSWAQATRLVRDSIRRSDVGANWRWCPGGEDVGALCQCCRVAAKSAEVAQEGRAAPVETVLSFCPLAACPQAPGRFPRRLATLPLAPARLRRCQHHAQGRSVVGAPLHGTRGGSDTAAAPIAVLRLLADPQLTGPAPTRLLAPRRPPLVPRP